MRHSPSGARPKRRRTPLRLPHGVPPAAPGEAMGAPPCPIVPSPSSRASGTTSLLRVGDALSLSPRGRGCPKGREGARSRPTWETTVARCYPRQEWRYAIRRLCRSVWHWSVGIAVHPPLPRTRLIRANCAGWQLTRCAPSPVICAGVRAGRPSAATSRACSAAWMMERGQPRDEVTDPPARRSIAKLPAPSPSAPSELRGLDRSVTCWCASRGPPGCAPSRPSMNRYRRKPLGDIPAVEKPV